jgi:hypothetical protein
MTTFLTPRLLEAVSLAVAVHSPMKRKGDDLPYIVHPMAVFGLLARWGADEDICIAGLLHDVIEDAENDVKRAEYQKEILEKFGADVLEIMEGVTEQDKSLPWRKRKELYLEHLKVASIPSLLVSCADHTHNSQSLAESYAREGEKVWTRFNAGKDEKFWYLKETLSILDERLEQHFVQDLHTNAKLLHDLIGNMPNITSTVLCGDQLNRFKDHHRRKGKTESEIEPLLREYESRVLAKERPTPEQLVQWQKEGEEFLRSGLGVPEEEITALRKKAVSKKSSNKSFAELFAKNLNRNVRKEVDIMELMKTLISTKGKKPWEIEQEAWGIYQKIEEIYETWSMAMDK